MLVGHNSHPQAQFGKMIHHGGRHWHLTLHLRTYFSDQYTNNIS